jgi:hypothetical protein
MQQKKPNSKIKNIFVKKALVMHMYPFKKNHKIKKIISIIISNT